MEAAWKLDGCFTAGETNDQLQSVIETCHGCGLRTASRDVHVWPLIHGWQSASAASSLNVPYVRGIVIVAMPG